MSVDQFLLSADTTDLNYPEIRPTLDLNFARTKTLDPRITFTRASGGSYVGAGGLIKYAGVNEARFDHDPSTGESLGLLIEEARTNLSLNSQDFTNTSQQGWSITVSRATRISDTGIDDPSGGTTASRWESGTTNSEELIYHILPSELTIGVTYTASVWIRRVSGTGNVNLVIGDNVSLSVTSQLNSVPYGTWVRCSSSRTITGANGPPGRAFIAIYPSNFFSGTPTTIDIWGYQMEQGSFPTSYIPTQGSTRTRAADNAQITGKNFSEWYRQDEGTIFSQSDVPKSTLGVVYYITETALDDIIGLRGATSGTIVQFLAFNVSRSSNIFVYQISNTDRFKGSFAYETDNTIASFNGILSPIDSTVSISNPTSLQIGKISTNARHLNGTISRLTYFPKRLPNAQLQALTR